MRIFNLNEDMIEQLKNNKTKIFFMICVYAYIFLNISACSISKAKDDRETSYPQMVANNFKNKYKIDKHPKFISIYSSKKSIAEKDKELYQYSPKGFVAMNLTDLDKYTDTLIKLAESSEDLCAGFWKGNSDNNLFNQKVELLDRTEQEQFADLNAKALYFGLEEKNKKIKIIPEIYEEGIKLLFNNLNQTETDKYKVLLNKNMTTDEESCWLYIKTMTIKNLFKEKTKKHQFLQYIQNIYVAQ